MHHRLVGGRNVVEDVRGRIVQSQVGVGRGRVDVGLVALDLGFEVAMRGEVSQ